MEGIMTISSTFKFFAFSLPAFLFIVLFFYSIDTTVADNKVFYVNSLFHWGLSFVAFKISAIHNSNIFYKYNIIITLYFLLIYLTMPVK